MAAWGANVENSGMRKRNVAVTERTLRADTLEGGGYDEDRGGRNLRVMPREGPGAR